MNDENLIPFNQRSEAEARELGKKGGIKSGEVRRKKAAEREALKLTLETLLKGDREVIDGESGNTQLACCIAMIKEVLKGNIKAFETLRDTIGEKPADKQEISGTNLIQKVFITPQEVKETNKHIDDVLNE